MDFTRYRCFANISSLIIFTYRKAVYMPTMDIVSEINMEEVRNATQNASRELDTRFDFRGVEASIEFKKPNVVLKAEGDFQLKQ